MRFKSTNKFVTLFIILGICHSIYSFRPSALLKRSLLRRRLLSLPAAALNGTQRLKRQLFREQIPHDRPLSGNTYYLHAGFPHPSRFHEGPQIHLPNPNSIHHRKPSLHHNHNEFDDHQHLHHNGINQQEDPFKVSLVHSQVPQSEIVHGDGVDNSLVQPPPDIKFFHPPPNLSPPYPPPSSEHHDDIHDHQYHHRPHYFRKPKRPRPHSEPEFNDDDDDYGRRKPKTIIHYHPVTVGNVINFSGAPLSHLPEHHKEHHKDAMLAIAEPLKTFNGPPPNLSPPYPPNDGYEPPPRKPKYGPPHYVPGAPLEYHPPPPEVMLAIAKTFNGPPPDFFDFVAAPVLAHLHSTAHHHHHPRKRPAKCHRRRHHIHHIHHNIPPPPGAIGSPFFDIKQQSYVNGHVPTKLVSFHSPNFKSHAHSHHHQRTFWL